MFRALFSFLGFLLEALWALVVLATPLLGVWLSSTLISFYGGPSELAVVGGVLLFPALPLIWELRATRRWNQKQQSRRQLAGKPKRRSTLAIRLIARTLFVNLAFLAVLLVWFPKVAFTALATRGDWFLGDRQQTWAKIVRKTAFSSAAGLEWLHAWANPNPWKKPEDQKSFQGEVKPTEQVTPDEAIARRFSSPWPRRPEPEPPPLPETADAGVTEGVIPPTPTPEAPRPEAKDFAWRVGETTWPWPNTVHPAVAALQPADERSIESVARALAANESDPFGRVKALHDWVVTRLRYDQASMNPATRKKQDAAAVFENRVAVCEGYARLLVALGEVTGDHIAFVVGEVREASGAVAPVGHAWNAVEIHGAWYLVDATWDDPLGPSDVYRTDYLFVPPSVAVLDHFPEDTRLQLLSQPLSRGDFLRQAMTGPGLAREGLKLLSPDRSLVEVSDALEVKVDNPRRLFLSLQVATNGSQPEQECGVDDAATVTLRCPLAVPGQYEVRLFSNVERYGVFGHVASLVAVRR